MAVVESGSVHLAGVVSGRLAVHCILDDEDFGRTVLKPFTNNWMAAFGNA
jgi:hypothetical protein